MDSGRALNSTSENENRALAITGARFVNVFVEEGLVRGHRRRMKYHDGTSKS